MIKIQLLYVFVLSAERRAAALRWARERDALVIEDDYDAEYRYDRAPIGAMQGLAPDLVAYAGTASKTLAPGLRLGWLVLPPRLVDPSPTPSVSPTAARRCSISWRSPTSWTVGSSIATCAASPPVPAPPRRAAGRPREHAPALEPAGVAAGLHLRRLPPGRRRRDGRGRGRRPARPAG